MRAIIISLGILLAGCTGNVSSQLGPGGPNGDGDLGLGDSSGVNFDHSSGNANTGACGTDLVGTIRDFRIEHPDFEYKIVTEKGIVADQLGSDGKPAYLGGQGQSTTGKANFDQWYNNVAGVNAAKPFTIQLKPAGGGIYRYDSSAFFPIDDQLSGNEGNPHNYHFTYEIRAQFRYLGGEIFSFKGDDDLFVFINKRLAIDLGGVHGVMSATVDLDQRAKALGIEKGKTYTLDFFFAERHTVESHFRIDTSIQFTHCGEVPK
jgi:fibro-slime domain-containing protein